MPQRCKIQPMKRSLKKHFPFSKRKRMEQTFFNVRGEVVTDDQGHTKLILDLEELQKLTQKKEEKKRTDFSSLLGAALKAPLNPNPRFKTEDDLWEGMP